MYLDLRWNRGRIWCRPGPSTFQGYSDYTYQVLGPSLHQILPRLQRQFWEWSIATKTKLLLITLCLPWHGNFKHCSSCNFERHSYGCYGIPTYLEDSLFGYLFRSTWEQGRNQLYNRDSQNEENDIHHIHVHGFTDKMLSGKPCRLFFIKTLERILCAGAISRVSFLDLFLTDYWGN